MKKYTINKTYILVKESSLLNIFGLEDNKPFVITKENYSSLRDYVEETYKDANRLAFLTVIEDELKTVDEVQFILEKE